MNNSERARAILHYRDPDRLPLVHFGFLRDTLRTWAAQGHITEEQAEQWQDRNTVDKEITERLGFDCTWAKSRFHPITELLPPIEEQILEELPDGKRKVLTSDGAIVLQRDGVDTISAELDHTLKGRKEWEEIFLPRLRFCMERLTSTTVNIEGQPVPFTEGGLRLLKQGEWKDPYGLRCGSLYGVVRNWLGLVGSAYLQVDDPMLFDEVLDTMGELSYLCTQAALEIDAPFDFGHFWEDIAFRSGPLINPKVLREKAGPHYRRIADLLNRHGIDIVSVDCDGRIDELVPIWLENGVNTMFPIEVGTWNANLRTWRQRYGKQVRGVGGMDKRIFAKDYAAVQGEVERLKLLVDMGGYIPCPDHRIPPDAKWQNVQFYCERMRCTFG